VLIVPALHSHANHMDEPLDERSLRHAELARYHRQMLVPGIGAAGQRALQAAHVAIVGIGALGCASADLLCRAGVGRITLIDRDVVELTNLQRQTLFTTLDARSGLPKVEAAAMRLREVNPEVALRPLAVDLTRSNAIDVLALAKGSDVPAPSVLIDGTDNFGTRYLLNDIAVKHGCALSYGGVLAGRGMSLLLRPSREENRPCLRCVFPQMPGAGSVQTCDTAGVLGPAVAIVAATQAAEVLKLLVGETARLTGTLLEFDVWNNERRRILPVRDEACVCCEGRRFEFLDGSAASVEPAVMCGQDAVQVGPSVVSERGETVIDLAALATRLSELGDVKQSKLMLRFTPHTLLHDTPIRMTVFADARAIVHGTTRVDVARSLYARYVGC
jgi:adenylyltransferase/sulfurtransferase